ncbi:L-rhamnose isomerase [Loigolactobacillus coryniformis]|uniref:L-rhamnose isomerase n=3 Tax=Loigolactobacillus coryniformis TaxID=1610 RepID=J3JCA9_9LACO|nr:L-rhamnose isomerase [Loigolactobacillus coryniformis]EJN56437.1 L-rhamnose isomerase [Loigolactobacillus coryniformis subsp. coryniformis CECT 5711]MBW4803731.1 L-rhamnose isomerase [Loigolactobacillus coryniformis subsp. torquens]MBW4806433.1 L-rhamnose isomerase [Loigolactobacillus coryniformis subsp. torquens]
MVKVQEVEKAYEIAKQRYADIGVDTEKVMEQLKAIKLSVHCWQGDDIHGFLFPNQELTGGIGVSGNYPGIARTPDELTSDLHEALSLIPGQHKVQIHAIYAVTDKKKDLNELEPEDFKYWVDWAKQEGVGLDMNGTFFSHPMVKNNFTLASPDPDVRSFWIEHGKRSRLIANYLGKELGQQSVNNFWIPDGFKDNPIDKVTPRLRLIDSLDQIIAQKLPEENTIEAFEGKLFGTGIESYTVGSHLFYNNYALTRNKLWTIDAGHWHPTEDVSDKFSAFLPFGKGLMLHVSRPVRWDSDHVVIFDEALVRIARSLVRDNELDKTNIGLDFFDATINRVAAWVIGARATQKALLQAMLAPIDQLRKAEFNFDFTTRLAETEELKSYPFGAVWDKFCLDNNVPVGNDWLNNIHDYEKTVQFKR